MTAYGIIAGPSPRELQEVARQTLESIEGRSQLLSFFYRSRKHLFDVVAKCRATVRRADPQQFTDQQFVEVDEALAGVIDALEQHLARNVHASDIAQCMFLGDSIQEFREARSWIVQGYSPDPKKRPSDAERRQQAEERAVTELSKLFA